MQTALDIFAAMAGRHDAAVTEFNRRGQPKVSRTHAELHDRARAIAATMRDSGVRSGDAVFLQLPNGCDIIEQFFAAMLLGALPCCLAPPRALGGIAAYQQRMASLFGAFAGCHLVALEDTGSKAEQTYCEPFVPSTDARPVDVPTVERDALAFLQLTSGTSRAPKAVRINQGALAANALGILRGGRAIPEDDFVSWLPLYHDMGLVGMLFCALANGSSLQLFRPDTFAARPLTWLRTIAELPGTGVSTAPNFAYQHCTREISAADAASLDLSRWRVAGCGAERVRPETFELFTEHFAAAGFRPESFVACYGMAEATLAVTFDRHGRPPRVVDGEVSCGRPIPDTEIVIRNPAGAPVADGEPGEITVRGPGLFSGYTADDVPDPIVDGWLHTGDLGLLRDGELFVRGRLKDLIIIDGHNLDPTEVEAIASDAIQTPGGRYAAFPTEVDGRERVVLAVEVNRRDITRFAEWTDVIDREVASLFGFRLHDLVFVPRGTLPATSSGKVRRAEVRRLHELDQLPRLIDDSTL